MFISDKAFACRSFISQSSLTSKVAVGIVTGVALLVAGGLAYGPADTLDSLDMEAIHSMTASQIHDDPSKRLSIETGPTRSARSLSGETATVISPQESRDIEAGMVNGHIQAF